MILVIENHATLEPIAPPPRAHECSLQLTLRRLGFHAARPAPKHAQKHQLPPGHRTKEHVDEH